jgi:3-oxoadipate enol-lactonase
MDYIEINNIRFRICLNGSENLPVVVLSNSLGTSLDMWEAQIPELSAKYRVLRYDNR